MAERDGDLDDGPDEPAAAPTPAAPDGRRRQQQRRLPDGQAPADRADEDVGAPSTPAAEIVATAHSSSVRSARMALMVSSPTPRSAPVNSPTRAPRNAAGAATCRPAKRYGTQARARTVVSVRQPAAAVAGDEVGPRLGHGPQPDEHRHERRVEDGQRGERDLRPVAGAVDDAQQRAHRHQRQAEHDERDAQHDALGRPGRPPRARRAASGGQVAPQEPAGRLPQRRAQRPAGTAPSCRRSARRCPVGGAIRFLPSSTVRASSSHADEHDDEAERRAGDVADVDGAGAAAASRRRRGRRLGRHDQRHVVTASLAGAVDVDAEQHPDLVDELVEPRQVEVAGPARPLDRHGDGRRRCGPGRGVITTTSSASSTASGIEWVTSSVVLPRSCQIGGSSRLSRRRVSSSTAPNGSSSSSRRGDGDEAAGDGRALAHAARQLGRLGLLEAGEPDEVDQLVRRGPGRPAAGPACGPARCSTSPSATAAARRPGRRRRSAPSRRSSAGSSPSIDDRAGRRRLEPGDDPQQRRLAAARRADERGDRAGPQRQRRRRRGRRRRVRRRRTACRPRCRRPAERRRRRDGRRSPPRSLAAVGGRRRIRSSARRRRSPRAASGRTARRWRPRCRGRRTAPCCPRRSRR